MKKGTKHTSETRIKMRNKRKPGHNIGRYVRTPEIKLRISSHLKSIGMKPPKSRMFGKENPAWKGGITPENKKIRHSIEYRIWREAVFKRDNYKCIWCGSIGYLNADHIKPFAFFPELRFAIDNGRTLCVPCHKTTDTYKAKKYEQKH